MSAGQAVRAGDKGALREQRFSGVLGPLSSCESLPLAFVLCCDRPRYCLSAATSSTSSSSARKRQWTASKQVQSTRERGRRRRRTAPIASPGPPRRCLPPPHTHPTTPRRTRRRRRTTQTATWPQQAPPPHRGPAGRRPRSRCSDSYRAPPRLALYPLPALAQRTTHHDRPCKQASGC